MHNITIEFIIALFILGATSLAFIYHIILYYFSKDKLLIHYLIYLFCTSIFLFSKTGLYAYLFGKEAQSTMWFYFREAIQIVYLTSYFNFIIQTIRITVPEKTVLHRIWKFTLPILIIYTIGFTWAKLFFEFQNHTIPFISIRVFIFVVTGIMLYHSYQLRNIKFQLLILYGCTIYFLFGLMSFLTDFLSDDDSRFIYPLEWLMIGSFLDIIFFTIAVAYREKKQLISLNTSLLEEANKKIALQKIVLEKQSELENERSRIAADMHDDLGSGLTKITYLSQMALNPANTESNLMKIKKTSSELVENMSEIIWAMKEENNTLEDLATYIKSYAVEYFENNNILLQISIPEVFNEVTINGNNRK